MSQRHDDRAPLHSALDHDDASGHPPRLTGPVGGDAPSAQQLGQIKAEHHPPAHLNETVPASADKHLYDKLPQLTDDELRRLSVLDTGAALEQGGVYLDLNDVAAGPFTAEGGMTAGATQHLIAKRETDYLLWNQLTGRDANGDGVVDAAQGGGRS
ncbi:MAG: hypothetical protein IT337_03750 [Thermomicrobiales bacterium]|nr:hypothetical protein [Thermomicrobiales bacterium]